MQLHAHCGVPVAIPVVEKELLALRDVRFGADEDGNGIGWHVEPEPLQQRGDGRGQADEGVLTILLAPRVVDVPSPLAAHPLRILCVNVPLVAKSPIIIE